MTSPLGHALNHHLAQQARALVHSRRKSGRLTQPDACEACWEKNSIILAHHEDYAKPLEIRWLCPGCHRVRHKELK